MDVLGSLYRRKKIRNVQYKPVDQLPNHTAKTGQFKQ